MKINTNRDELLGPLLKVGNVVERRQTLPILANMLISAASGRLQFTATDLEVELTTSACAEADGDIEFTLPARKLIEICRALPKGASMTLEIEGDKATLRSGYSRFTIGMLPAQDYPTIDPATASEQLNFPESILKRLIDKTAFAMAHQDVRYYLNGLLLEITTNRVRAVATDGHRLALCDAELDTGVGSDIQIILPRKAVLELGRLLNDDDGALQLEISNSHARVRFGNTIFTTKLIDGRFPNYERVMPSGDTQRLLADCDSLRQSLIRTSILSNEKYRGIRFRLVPKLLHLHAHNSEQDEAKEELEIDYQGNEIIVGFNVGYLLDVLNVLDTKQVSMSLIDSSSSALMTPAGSMDCRYVVMPMRL